MNTLFIDQPGLLGPKALMALIILSHARDEVHWLLRHAGNVPQKLEKRKNLSDDLNDRQLPELLFYIEELRGQFQLCARGDVLGYTRGYMNSTSGVRQE